MVCSDQPCHFLVLKKNSPGFLSSVCFAQETDDLAVHFFGSFQERVLDGLVVHFFEHVQAFVLLAPERVPSGFALDDQQLEGVVLPDYFGFPGYPDCHRFCPIFVRKPESVCYPVAQLRDLLNYRSQVLILFLSLLLFLPSYQLDGQGVDSGPGLLLYPVPCSPVDGRFCCFRNLMVCYP